MRWQSPNHCEHHHCRTEQYLRKIEMYEETVYEMHVGIILAAGITKQWKLYFDTFGLQIFLLRKIRKTENVAVNNPMKRGGFILYLPMCYLSNADINLQSNILTVKSLDLPNVAAHSTANRNKDHLSTVMECLARGFLSQHLVRR